MALDFIRRDRPQVADRVFDRVEQKLRRLQDFPDSGRRIPEYDDELHREVVIPPFRFFYRIEGDNIEILNVWHEAQLPNRPDPPE